MKEGDEMSKICEVLGVGEMEEFNFSENNRRYKIIDGELFHKKVIIGKSHFPLMNCLLLSTIQKESSVNRKSS